MPKISKTIVDKHLRDMIFADLIEASDNAYQYQKINDRQYGVLLTDDNNVERYVRIGAIVAEEREDMTAAELMQSEIDKYNESVSKKQEKEAEKKKKIAEDKKKREEKKNDSDD
jgi:hypothetical protein